MRTISITDVTAVNAPALDAALRAGVGERITRQRGPDDGPRMILPHHLGLLARAVQP